jgi:hypothetical protein
MFRGLKTVVEACEAQIVGNQEKIAHCLQEALKYGLI